MYSLCVTVVSNGKYSPHTDKPGAPVDLAVADMNETSVALTWNTPEDDGGSEIKNYVIEQRDVGKRAWKACGSSPSTTYTALALNAGTTYMFRVAAENDVGRGDFAELTQSVVPKSQFGKSNYCLPISIM